MNKIDDLLIQMENIIENGINKDGVIRILDILRCPFPFEFLEDIKLYGDYLPKNAELGFSEEKRYLHFLWDVLDKSPMCLIANFAIPFRAMLASKLFKSCGKNFIAEENVRFNIPDNIEMGDNVFINKGTLIDGKGGFIVGNSVGIGEGVTIFTHSHTEHDHSLRNYAPVIIKDYAKIYSNSTILPGVTIGEQSIVAACSLVNKDVEKNALVAGTPAKYIRNRETFDNSRASLGHIWLHNGEFQK